MQVGCSRYRHCITTLLVGFGVAHHLEHLGKWQKAGRLGRSPGFGDRSVARALLSSTRFTSARHGI
jgi:hypothetical protein